jgi:hypothetical protein
MNVSPTLSETAQMESRFQNEPISPTPHRQQSRTELRAEKKAQSRSTDITPFFKIYKDKTKHCKFCL